MLDIGGGSRCQPRVPGRTASREHHHRRSVRVAAENRPGTRPQWLGKCRRRHADATGSSRRGGPRVDVVTFYSLTMIPAWFQALENALACLKPSRNSWRGVDFYVTRKWPEPGLKRHGIFWRYLSAHLVWLRQRLPLPGPLALVADFHLQTVRLERGTPRPGAVYAGSESSSLHLHRTQGVSMDTPDESRRSQSARATQRHGMTQTGATPRADDVNSSRWQSSWDSPSSSP